MEKICPLIKKSCLEQGCTFWTHLIGKNPQTSVSVDEWNCSITFLPILLVENASVMRNVQAGVDKVANETRGVTDFFGKAMNQTKIDNDLNGDTKQLPRPS